MIGSLCDVCGEAPAIGVGAMPGVPISFSYCKDCLKANAHPYAIVVANTALLGGLSETAVWWQALVADTLAHLHNTPEEFNASVQADMEEFAEAEARANEEFARTEEGGESCWSFPVLRESGDAT